jgi:hypothetical protein
VIAGTIRNLFNKSQPCLGLENQAFRALTLFYALRHRDGSLSPQVLSEKFDGEDLEQVLSELHPQESGVTQRDASVVSLLQLFHRRVFKKFKGHQPRSEELKRYLKEAHHTGRINEGSSYERIIREEQWNQLALLAVELLGDVEEDKSLMSKLIDEVATRLKRKESRKADKSPAWGYRCMDHCLRIDLAIAQSKFGKASEHLPETLQDAYCDCLYFLRSDHSFLKSWDASEPVWTSDLWNLECSSIVSSSFLSIVTFDWSNITANSNPPCSLIG